MILSFKNRQTELFFREGIVVKEFEAFKSVATRKLDMLDAAVLLQDLKSPPGNRLEILYGDREGQHSIRINDQYRICFTWEKGNAYQVEITDYH
ncbi:MAG: type II toxin-antitoxin system RelE/ParE family toxin [Candidatus Melainabacteria bacterium]|jgi:proteic killer suppression protein